MAERPIARLETLSQGTRTLAAAALQADRRLQGQALAALPQSALPDLRLLTGTHWHWLLEVVERQGRRFLVWRQRDVHPVLRIGLELSLKPVPKNRPPETAPQLPPVLLERPTVLLPSTPRNLRRYVPDDNVTAENTVLLQLGRGRVLAVRRPDYLLGLLKAKLWWQGQRLEPSGGEWSADPFLALAQAVSAWRSGRGGIEAVPLTADPEDALMQVVAEIVRARHGLLTTLFDASRADLQMPHLGALAADQALIHLHADLALRLDVAGDLTDAEDSKSVFVRAHLDFGDGDPLPAHSGRLRLDPPDFLASGEVLGSLLDALDDDAPHWRAWGLGLSTRHLRSLLGDAKTPNSGTFALRVGRALRRERWVLFLFQPGARAVRSVLEADFQRGPVPDDVSRPRLPGAVDGRRKVLHRSDHRVGQGRLDNDVVRAFLRLIAALHRYGQAVF